ncbi:unnamed protein product [Musa acuminata var. zebrina]
MLTHYLDQFSFRWEGIITADHRRPRGKSPLIAPVISSQSSLVRIVKMDEQIVSALGEVGIDLKVSSHVIGEVGAGPTITSNYGLSSSGTTRQSKEANYKVWSQWLPDRAADIKLWMDW